MLATVDRLVAVASLTMVGGGFVVLMAMPFGAGMDASPFMASIVLGIAGLFGRTR